VDLTPEGVLSVSDAVLARYMTLFEGRDDQYAQGYVDERKPWKNRYRTVNAPLTPDVVRRHIDGEETFGLYCERNGLAKWLALDFDSPKDENGHPVDGGYEVAAAEAAAFRADLLRKGLFTHVERSRSGNGVHVWGFLDGWVDARELAGLVARLLRPEFKTVDKGKIYPPLRQSGNSILICFPYAGEAVERGNSMFLDDAGAEIPLEAFLDQVRVNPASVLARVGAEALAAAPARPGAREPGAASFAPDLRVGEFEGRPKVLGTGIMKMLSPFGCNVMRQIWLNQHDSSLVGEPAWHAMLLQLSAFKHGRDAAHALFRSHKYYDERGCDEKFDHAAQNPPHGCQYLHENFPQFKCAGCPMTAPYRRGYQSLTQLCGESPEELRRALYKKDLERIRRLDASPTPAGITSGIPGVDDQFRLVPGDFVAIGAQPSIGKTALGVHMVNTVAPTGVDVAVFSAESGPVSFHNRQIAHRAGIDSYALTGTRSQGGQKVRLSAEEWAAVEEATDWLEGQPIWENYTTASPERIYDAIEAMLCGRRRPLTDPALVLFDYFQYAQPIDDDRKVEPHVVLARASHAFKCVTKVVEHPLVVFAQLIRESEGDDDPKINWWRGTARLEHDIDGGIIMTGERMPGRHVPRRIHCVKRREGQVGWKQDLLLEQSTCRFEGPPAQAAPAGEQLHDPPWETGAGQMTLVKPSDDVPW
jgi:KaiC/GvpD/RAD55 family RecA-like ATPase